MKKEKRGCLFSSSPFHVPYLQKGLEFLVLGFAVEELQKGMKVLLDNHAAEIMMLREEYHGMSEKLLKAWHLFPGLDDQESMIMTTCSSLQIQVQSLHQEAHEVQELSLPTLPRKLMRITEEMGLKETEAQNVMPKNQQSVGDDTSGKGNRHQNEQVAKHGKGGTWQEWAQGTGPSQFFTMDYTNVRRRPPIHNKSPPVSP